MATPFHVRFTRFSAFYSPLIVTVTGGFLEAEGFEPSLSIAKPGQSTTEALLSGEAQVGQTAPVGNIMIVDRGETPSTMDFASINEKDGFFIAGREPDPDFNWKKLEGRRVLIDFGGQPEAVFRWACRKNGCDDSKILGVKVLYTEMEDAFRRGTGDYVQLQGPGPQMIEHDGVGHVVAAHADNVDPIAFSSIAATPEFLASDMGRAFAQAYRRARDFINDAPAEEIATSIKPYFPNVDLGVLIGTVATYQGMGCWPRRAEIARDRYEAALDMFEALGMIKSRPPYEKVVAPMPA